MATLTILLKVLLTVVLAIAIQEVSDSATLRPATFYVATDGDDAWSGQLSAPNAAGTDGPYATLSRARDAIRELKATTGLQQRVNVLIRGGTYYLPEPLSLGPQDSGTEQCPIRYRAYRREKPVLCGGKIITGWRPYEGEIMQCSLPEVKAGNWKFRQLFFNGQRQIRARWPNLDPDDPLYGGWAFLEETLSEDGLSAFRYESDTAARHWAKPSQGELFILPWYCWISDLIPIKEADHERRVITPTRNAWHGWMVGNRFRIENMLEELDQPGEWCLDSETGTVYFWPPAGSVQDGEVTAPVPDRLIELIGTAEEPIKYVQISGLTLTQTLSPFPEQRHPNFHSCTYRGEAIRLENAEHCRIARNFVDQVGGDGVRLQDACAFNRIVDNEIAYTGGQGISFSSTDAKGNNYCGRDLEQLKQQAAEKSTMVRNLISNNHIHHCGVIEKHAAGILVWGINSVDNVISHNLIHHVPHSGLTAQDGFGRLIVQYNEMHDLSLEIADCGGIFTNRWLIVDGDEDLAEGNMIRHNLIRDVIGCGAYGSPTQPTSEGVTRADGRMWTPYYVWGIYFDNSVIKTTVYGNICIGNTLGGISMPVGSPHDNLVENNIFVESSIRQMDLGIYGDGSNRFVRNIVYYGHPTAALLHTSGGNAVGECDYNVYFHTDGKELRVTGVPEESLEKWQEMGFDTHSVVADPLFVDPGNGDYRLKPDSPALALGFKPIPIEQIGLRSK